MRWKARWNQYWIEIGEEHDLDDLQRQRLAADRGAETGQADGPVEDGGRRREGQEGDRLDHHRADQEIEQILAPFDAEQPLVAPVRKEPLERSEHQAGQRHVEDEEIEAEEDAPALRVARGGVDAAEQGRGRARCRARRSRAPSCA